MALIKCPGCEREVSDKAKICPGCGLQLIEEIAEDTVPGKLICEDCGAELEHDFKLCPVCGCPVPEAEVAAPAVDEPQKVEIASVNLDSVKKKSKKFVIIGIIAVVLAIAGVVIGFAVKSINEKNAATRYFSNMELAASSMLTGAADAESACNLIKKVWYNTIYEESDYETDEFTHGSYGFHDDFNDALAELFADEDFQSTISSIEDNQDAVAMLMKSLQNPPEEYTEAYAAIKELYDAYLELTGLAINPTGSLTTFSSNFNDADTEAIKCYNEVELYLD